MPEIKKKYWKSLEELQGDKKPIDSLSDEFPGASSDSFSFPFSRRSFLKLSGFAVTAGAFVGCSHAPLKKAIPYLIQQEEVVPGRSYWYASVCGACPAGCGILTKNRDGRPIKLEGNPTHPVSRGGLCAVGQASVLGLYDSQRLKGPLALRKESSWSRIDKAITGKIAELRASNGALRVLTGPVHSPSLRRSIGFLLSSVRDSRHITGDPLSVSAILDAHKHTHGLRVLPRINFEEADVIVGFDADFLGTWLSPVEYTEAYRTRRDPGSMSWHLQIESRLSITGAKADRRICLSPGEYSQAMRALAAAVADFHGGPRHFPAPPSAGISQEMIQEISSRLWQARGRSLVVCGCNDVHLQILVNTINHFLGSYGSTLDLTRPSYQHQESDRELSDLLEEMNAGKVSALFIHGVNPAYDIPGMREALKKVPLIVSLSERIDETSSMAHYVCPDHHFLESWGDAEPVAGIASIAQPAIRPIGQTRSAIESFAAWASEPKAEYDLVRECWGESLYPRQKQFDSFDAFWERTLHDGHAILKAQPLSPAAFDPGNIQTSPFARPATMQNPCLVVHPTVALLDGRHAHNPWLQELPDPISKICWDNYVSMAPAFAVTMGIREGDVVRVMNQNSAGDVAVELPAHIQPGQHEGVLSIPLGYGRMGTDRFSKQGPQWIEARPTVQPGETVGKNAAFFKSFDGNCMRYFAASVKVTKTGLRKDLAATQMHHTLTVPPHLSGGHFEPRPIVQETTLAAFLKNPHSGAEHLPEAKGIWPEDHAFNGMHWKMAIDLTKCTGCSACVISCQAENNIPVVGKDEVRRMREMHWIRIDRYYAEHESGIDVVFQPMMCQHCAHAPCETVCPVLATVRSSEGLNQQVYNRCVGTRYCANNCPYKARRFNWFDYSRADRLNNMVLNPDVTVRSRGVMEKCSFCIQRVQEAKAEAARKGEPVRDGDVMPACAQSCPAGAIVFGNLNDPKSAISASHRNPRHYEVLAELNVRPSVGYLRLIRNRKEGENEH